ncbi:MAG: sigma 54-interacting transcriptional regulator [Myxococcota bacterium]
MVSSVVADALHALESNPFAYEADDFQAKLERVVRLPKSRTIVEALEVGKVALAEQRLLAIGHAEVLTGVESILEQPPRVWKALPRERAAYVRIVKAAGRCYEALSRLAGTSSAMQQIRRDTWSACFGDTLYNALILEQVIKDHDVLILGETGTGKEAIAEAIQLGQPGGLDGGRAPRNALNAAAVPETLIESELFGHVKGAFTGATVERKGRIRSAKGGCFFLDEVGDLRETTQVKLLRVMETNIVSPLGADKGFVADVRYVAATHKDLEGMVDSGEFRRDLYERLAGHVIRLPPLRERREDIPALGRIFAQRYLPKSGGEEVLERVEKWLRRVASRAYAWPGNVRELQNKLRSVMLGFEPEVALTPTAPSVDVPSGVLDATASMRELTDWYLLRVLERSDHNFAAASRILGVDRSTIRRRAKKLQQIS